MVLEMWCNSNEWPCYREIKEEKVFCLHFCHNMLCITTVIFCALAMIKLSLLLLHGKLVSDFSLFVQSFSENCVNVSRNTSYNTL